MSNLSAIQEQNRDLAIRINEDALRDPASPYSGKFVGIVNGEVKVVADSVDELGRKLDELSAPPEATYCIEASRDYSQVEHVWSNR